SPSPLFFSSPSNPGREVAAPPSLSLPSHRAGPFLAALSSPLRSPLTGCSEEQRRGEGRWRRTVGRGLAAAWRQDALRDVMQRGGERCGGGMRCGGDIRRGGGMRPDGGAWPSPGMPPPLRPLSTSLVGGGADSGEQAAGAGSGQQR
ncbi:unnamed protein product, partial [Urochloa humidicola]